MENRDDMDKLKLILIIIYKTIIFIKENQLI